MSKFFELHILNLVRKVIYSLLLCLILFFSHTLSVNASDNLIANPSIETESNHWPANWQKMKTGNNVSVFTYKRQGGQDGPKSLNTEVTQYVAGESAWYFDEVNVSPNTTYSYSEYYKSSMNTQLYLRVTNTGGSQTESQLMDVAPSSDWNNISLNFVTPPDASKVTIMHKTSSLGFLQMDNFSLTTEGSPSVTPTPTATPTLTITPTATPSPSPSPTITPSPTATPSPSPSPTVTPSPSPTTTPSPSPTPSANNPIPNPSLETVNPNNSNLPLHWRHAKTGTNNAKFKYLNTGHTGSRSLRIDVTSYTSGIAYYYFDTAPVEGGKTYEYSTYYKSDSYAEVDAEIRLSNGETEYQYLGVSYPSSDWSRFSTQIRMPDNAVSVSIYNMIYSVGYLVTDDYDLKQVNTQPFNRAIVTLTFDDYFNSLYNTVFPMFENYGYKGTAYLLTEDIGGSNILTADQLLEMHAYGFEIGSHTVTHAHLPFISYDEVDHELSQSKTDIENFLGITPINFASPYGEYNDTVKSQIAQYYGSHRSVDVGFNSKDNFDRYNIRAMSAVVNTSPDTVLEWVDQAIADKTWLVIVYHDIIPNGGTFTNTPQHLQAVLDGLHQRGVQVMTVQDALNELVPQL